MRASISGRRITCEDVISSLPCLAFVVPLLVISHQKFASLNTSDTINKASNCYPTCQRSSWRTSQRNSRTSRWAIALPLLSRNSRKSRCGPANSGWRLECEEQKRRNQEPSRMRKLYSPSALVMMTGTHAPQILVSLLRLRS